MRFFFNWHTNLMNFQDEITRSFFLQKNLLQCEGVKNDHIQKFLYKTNKQPNRFILIHTYSLSSKQQIFLEKLLRNIIILCLLIDVQQLYIRKLNYKQWKPFSEAINKELSRLFFLIMHKLIIKLKHK